MQGDANGVVMMPSALGLCGIWRQRVALQLLYMCMTEGCSVPYVIVPIGVYHGCFLSLVVAMASTGSTM